MTLRARLTRPGKLEAAPEGFADSLIVDDISPSENDEWVRHVRLFLAYIECFGPVHTPTHNRLA